MPVFSLSGLRTLLDASYDGLYVAGATGITLYVNPAYERLSGLGSQDVLGHHVADLVQKGFFDQSVTLRVFDCRRSTTIKQRILPTNRNLLVTGNPVYDGSGALIGVVTNVRNLSQLEELYQSTRLTHESDLVMPDGAPDFIFTNPGMRSAVATAMKAARVDSTVLILGESGVGKSLIARIIHLASRRSKGPFVRLDCGAFPDTLLESELFGYEPGAFTGASRHGKIGLVEAANGGTLFLDEIGDLPIHLQAKILRLCEDKEFVKVGGLAPTKVNIRIIAATNRDLEQMAEQGFFRSDLLYRLSVVSICVPPLRERKDDILHLALHFLQQINRKCLFSKIFSSDALRRLVEYDWPGNVRQLHNAIERAAILSDGDLIEAKDLALETPFRWPETGTAPRMTLQQVVELAEKCYIERILNRYEKLSDAARILGVHYSTLYRKAVKYGIPGAKERMSSRRV